MAVVVDVGENTAERRVWQMGRSQNRREGGKRREVIGRRNTAERRVEMARIRKKRNGWME